MFCSSQNRISSSHGVIIFEQLSDILLCNLFSIDALPLLDNFLQSRIFRKRFDFFNERRIFRADDLEMVEGCAELVEGSDKSVATIGVHLTVVNSMQELFSVEFRK